MSVFKGPIFALALASIAYFAWVQLVNKPKPTAVSSELGQATQLATTTQPAGQIVPPAAPTIPPPVAPAPPSVPTPDAVLVEAKDSDSGIAPPNTDLMNKAFPSVGTETPLSVGETPVVTSQTPKEHTPPVSPPSVPGNPAATDPGLAITVPTPAIGGPVTNAAGVTLAEALQNARTMIQDQRLSDALDHLTPYWVRGGGTEEQRKELEQLLSRLAGKVIYSDKYQLERIFSTTSPTSLTQIAKMYNVTPQFLANINRYANAKPPYPINTPGVAVKVVKGPFFATIEPKKGLLTVYLDYESGTGKQTLYAGCVHFNALTASTIPAGSYKMMPSSNPEEKMIRFVNGQDHNATGIYLGSPGYQWGKQAGDVLITLSAKNIQDLRVILTPESNIQVVE